LAKSVAGGAGKLFFGGTLPSANYGTETVGMTKGNVVKLCASAARSLRLPKDMSHNPIAWSILSSGATLYPAAHLNALPAIRYARELWLATDTKLATSDTIPLNKLRAAFQEELEWLDAAPRTHCQMTSSPVALAIQSFRNAGFKVVDFVTLVTPEGLESNLLLGSPALLAQHMHEGWMRTRVNAKVASKLDGLTGNSAEAIRRTGLWLEPARKLFHSKARYALSFREKRCLLKFVSRSYVTGSTLCKWGFATLGTCPHPGCGQLDTVYHRIFTCPFFGEERRTLVPRHVLAKALAAGPSSLLFNCGWVEVPCDVVTQAQADGTMYSFFVGPDESEAVGPVPFSPLLPIYGDGSGLRPGHPIVARAGFSISQFDERGNHLVTARSPVPSFLPQNAAVAERLCIVAANQVLDSPLQAPYKGDCKPALKMIDDPLVSRAPSAPWASLAREVVACGCKVNSSAWVKAHRSVADANSEADRIDILCNAHVDRHAKDAALTVPISQSELTAYGNIFKGTSTILRAAARMLALWPPNKQLYGTLPRCRPVLAKAKSNLQPHKFVWNGKCWVCTFCLRRKFSARAAIDSISCGAITPAIAKVLAQPMGHRLLLVSTATDALLCFCSRCGYHGTSMLRRLAEQCQGPKVPRPTSLNRLFAVPPVHPLSREPVRRPYHANSMDFKFMPLLAPHAPSNSVPTSPSAPSFIAPCPVEGGFDDPFWQGFEEFDGDELGEDFVFGIDGDVEHDLSLGGVTGWHTMADHV